MIDRRTYVVFLMGTVVMIASVDVLVCVALGSTWIRADSGQDHCKASDLQGRNRKTHHECINLNPMTLSSSGLGQHCTGILYVALTWAKNLIFLCGSVLGVLNELGSKAQTELIQLWLGRAFISKVSPSSASKQGFNFLAPNDALPLPPPSPSIAFKHRIPTCNTISAVFKEWAFLHIYLIVKINIIL